MTGRDTKPLSATSSECSEESSDQYTPSNGKSSDDSDDDQSRFRRSWTEKATKMARMHDLAVPEKRRPQESSPGFVYSPNPLLVVSPAKCRVRTKKRKGILTRRKTYHNDDTVDELCELNDELAREADELESLLSRTQRNREKDLDTVRELEGYTDLLGNRVHRLEEQVKTKEDEKRNMSREISELRKALKEVERTSKPVEKDNSTVPPVAVKILQAKVKKLSKDNHQLQVNISQEKSKRSILEAEMSQLSSRIEKASTTLQLSHRDNQVSHRATTCTTRVTIPFRRCKSDSNTSTTNLKQRNVINCSPTNFTDATTIPSSQLSYRESASCSSSDDDDLLGPPSVRRVRARPAGVGGLDMAKVNAVRERDNRRSSAPVVPMSLVDELEETYRSVMGSNLEAVGPNLEAEDNNKLPHDPTELVTMFRYRNKSAANRSLTKTFMMLHADGAEEDDENFGNKNAGDSTIDVLEFGVSAQGNSTSEKWDLWTTVTNFATSIPRILLTPRDGQAQTTTITTPRKAEAQGISPVRGSGVCGSQTKSNNLMSTPSRYSPLHTARTARNTRPPEPSTVLSPCPSPASNVSPGSMPPTPRITLSPAVTPNSKAALVDPTGGTGFHVTYAPSQRLKSPQQFYSSPHIRL
eukprot:Selendium_serpulae@DN2636_c0_g1_i5.p1